MWQYIEERIESHARYVLETGCTVRACAKRFGTSKSTVHKDLTERLKKHDYALYLEVRTVLDKNLSERHIRGGLATKEMYRRKNEKGE